jgi:hypothetical protein
MAVAASEVVMRRAAASFAATTLDAALLGGPASAAAHEGLLASRQLAPTIAVAAIGSFTVGASARF